MTGPQHSKLSSHKSDPLASFRAEDVIDPARRQQVMRRMQYLTGMAAIGGFLFGYDTGAFLFVSLLVPGRTP